MELLTLPTSIMHPAESAAEVPQVMHTTQVQRNTMTPEIVLHAHAQPVPDWLARWTPQTGFPHSDFMTSRIVIYPGSGSDGHAFRTFGASHAAHCFVNPDYGVPREKIIEWLKPDSPQRLKGYLALPQVDLTLENLIPGGWKPPEFLDAFELKRIAAHEEHTLELFKVKPFALFVVLEREQHLDDTHGPERLCAVFLAGNAQITYHALFSQHGSAAPFGLLLQDHGFGGNYDHFGESGLLHRMATHSRRLPRFILGEKAWPNYTKQTDHPSIGGMHANRRFLFEHQPPR
jgi:hypothetical protein